jgi:hypothetical protein
MSNLEAIAGDASAGAVKKNKAANEVYFYSRAF